jgi:small subunit ribosomal protein S1
MRITMEENNQNMETEGGEKSFAELLGESEPDRGWLKPGQRVEAMIVKITPEWIFIDLGGKHEGYLDRKEFLDAEGKLTVKEGDAVRAYFLSSQHNEKLFTTKVGAGEAGRAFLEDAARSGIPVEGLIEREVKGGFEIKVAGDTRGFCPFSQMGLVRVETPADRVGQRLTFKIIEFGERGRNIVLSHRAILEEEQAKLREGLKTSLKEGMPVKGKIVSVQKFGAFVDIGGFQALIPISEIAWEHVADISERLSVGQEVEAAILKLDWEHNRIALSLRSNLPDPWERVEKEFSVGASFTGTVARLTKFGAFVTLLPGVDGLVHISKLGKGKRITHPSEVLAEGQSIAVKIENIDRENKRISLAPLGDAEEETAEELEDYQKYVGKAPGSFGSLGDALQENMGAIKKRQ